MVSFFMRQLFCFREQTNVMFDCQFLSSHIRVLELIYSLQLSECQGTFLLETSPTFEAYVTVLEFEARATQLLNEHSTSQPNWPVWINGWVFVYELSGCGCESRCSHLRYQKFCDETQIFTCIYVQTCLYSVSAASANIPTNYQANLFQILFLRLSFDLMPDSVSEQTIIRLQLLSFRLQLKTSVTQRKGNIK